MGPRTDKGSNAKATPRMVANANRHVGLMVTPSEEKALLRIAEMTGEDPGEVAVALLLRGLVAYAKEHDLSAKDFIECTRLTNTRS